MNRFMSEVITADVRLKVSSSLYSIPEFSKLKPFNYLKNINIVQSNMTTDNPNKVLYQVMFDYLQNICRDTVNQKNAGSKLSRAFARMQKASESSLVFLDMFSLFFVPYETVKKALKNEKLIKLILSYCVNLMYFDIAIKSGYEDVELLNLYLDTGSLNVTTNNMYDNYIINSAQQIAKKQLIKMVI